MTAYYLALVVVVLVTVGTRRWYQSAVARMAARDEAALHGPHPAMETAKFGARHRTADLGAPYDQTKTTQQQTRIDASARRQRAKTAKTIRDINAQWLKVTPMRRRAK